jgi:hypothetical protein
LIELCATTPCAPEPLASGNGKKTDVFFVTFLIIFIEKLFIFCIIKGIKPPAQKTPFA